MKKEMEAGANHEGLTYSDVINGYEDELGSHVAAPALLRKIHARLTESLESFSDEDSFAKGLMVKYCLEDLLKHTLEDDVVDGKALEESVLKLTALLQAAAQKSVPEWWTEMMAFARTYQEVSKSRQLDDTVTVQGIRFLVGASDTRPWIQQTPSGPPWFPALDETLADPQTGPSLLRWFTSTAKQLCVRARRREAPISGLCFFEKPYSTSGALLMLPQLVEATQLPATVFRPSYWQGAARTSGRRPLDGSNYLIVCDVTMGGTAVREVVNYWKTAFGARVAAAIVMFDFEKGAKEAFEREGLEFISYTTRSEVESELERKVNMMRSTARRVSGKAQVEAAETRKRVTDNFPKI